MIKFYLFGGCRAETESGVAIPFATAKARALLAYLVMTPGQEHTRQALAALLWPDATDAVALGNLRNTLARLRKSLENPDWLQATRQSIQLLHEPHQLWTDATAFDYLWHHLHTIDPIYAELAPESWATVQGQWMAEAVGLYQGEFLASLFWQEEEESSFWQWRRQKQEAYHTKALYLLEQLTEGATAARTYQLAADYARRQLALEPWRERAHRQLIVALAGAGDYTGALVQYEKCCQIVRRELRLEPEAETIALGEQLQAGRDATATTQLRTPNPRQNNTSAAAFKLPVTDAIAPNNLPAQLSPFIGRVADIAQLNRALRTADYRLHAVVGPGGMGKSRLALHVAALQLDHFADGVFFTPLAETSIVDEVLPAISRSLTLPIHDELPLRQQLVAHLAERHLLLVLDNVEHLLDEGTPDAGRFVALLLDLLQHAPALTIVVTSRRQLHLRAENLFLLDGLNYPTADTLVATSDPNELLHYDAIQLFVEQVQRVKKEFAWANEPAAVVKICETLQGMPLGIELAAAHVQQHDCATILAKLTDNLAQIQSNYQDAPTRHRSLSAVLAYSWALLPPAQQRLLAHCAIFQGGFAWDDCRALVTDVAAADLQALVDHCLLQQDNSLQQDKSRYSFHPLVQQYASERQIELQIDTAALAARHSRYFLEKLNQQRDEFYGLDLPLALAAVAQDWANIHAAWQWAVQAGRLIWLDQALDALCAAYYFRRHHEEGLHLWRDTAVAVDRQLESCWHPERQTWPRLAARLQIKQARHLSALQRIEETQACIALILTQSALEQEIEFELLLIQGWLDKHICEENSRRLIHLKDRIENSRLLGEYWLLIAFQQKNLGDVLAAYNAGTKSLPYYQAIHDYAGQVASHRSLAISSIHLGNLSDAQQYLETAMQWATQRQDPASEVSLQEILGIVYSRIGDHGAAMYAFTNAQYFYQQMGRQTVARSMAMNLALECAFLGDYAGARRHYELLIKQLTGLPQSDRSICYTNLNLGLLMHTTGEQVAALSTTEAALRLARTLQLPYLEGYALNNLGHILCALEQYDEAATAYQAALTLREQLEETFLALETRAGLARLAFTVGDLPLAREWIDPILTHLEDGTLDGAEEPFRVYLTCYLVLHAAGDRRAEPLVRQMQKELRTQADRITDPALRNSFLTQVPYHREIMELTTLTRTHPQPAR